MCKYGSKQLWYNIEKVNNNQLIIKLTKLELKQRYNHLQLL